MRLAWANTLHTFEGSNAGHTPDGTPKNSLHTVVIDVGQRADEARYCGLIYTAVSRPTTLGDAGSEVTIPYKCFNSVLYRRDETFPQHLEHLTHKIATREEYDKVHMQGMWVKHLRGREIITVEHINENEVLE
jgi:hypothetical protein